MEELFRANVMRLVTWMVITLALILNGCSGSGEGLDVNGNPIGLDKPDESGLFVEVEKIFIASCALSGCHTGATATASLDLSQGNAFNNIVNVPSGEQPERMRILPFDSNNSYLINKIRGDLNIIGSQMPFGKAPLLDAQIQTIVDWVDAGAEPPSQKLFTEYYNWQLINEEGNFHTINDGEIHFSKELSTRRKIYLWPKDTQLIVDSNTYPKGTVFINELTDNGVIIELSAMIKADNQWRWFYLKPSLYQQDSKNLGTILLNNQVSNDSCIACHNLATLDFNSDSVFFQRKVVY